MNTTHKLHIFDMDGTIPHDDDVNKLIEPYTLENAAKYFIEL